MSGERRYAGPTDVWPGTQAEWKIGCILSTIARVTERGLDVRAILVDDALARELSTPDGSRIRQIGLVRVRPVPEGVITQEGFVLAVVPK